MLPNEGPIQGVVFFNETDTICVIDRKGRVEPLQTSPFARQLQACFVFLDEAHTRGIDLKLPVDYRAAVTLGPQITKDKLVQVDRCREFQDVDFVSSNLEEEQQRELAPETECERQVQRPPEAVPAVHRIHQHLGYFVSTGILKLSSGTFKPAFEALHNTSAASFLDLTHFPPSLLVTKDFVTTVKVPVGSKFIGDAFQRPVRWILSCNKYVDSADPYTVTLLLIISPYEANCFMPEIQKSEFVTLHIYSPRQNQGFSPLDHLMLHNIPARGRDIKVPDFLRNQLNLFSGQLYLNSYLEYQSLCEFLGVASVKTSAGLIVAADGFIQPGSAASRSTFHKSPIRFLSILMSDIRKDCQEVGKTHIGRILRGQLLSQSDFLDNYSSSSASTEYADMEDADIKDEDMEDVDIKTEDIKDEDMKVVDMLK
ncbi:hypothetical protein N7490_008671 [Penicillium lividum]|nr:hypothetical protein N7490_008671 [Penicillium lividum]